MNRWGDRSSASEPANSLCPRRNRPSSRGGEFLIVIVAVVDSQHARVAERSALTTPSWRARTAQSAGWDHARARRPQRVYPLCRSPIWRKALPPRGNGVAKPPSRPKFACNYGVLLRPQRDSNSKTVNHENINRGAALRCFVSDSEEFVESALGRGGVGRTVAFPAGMATGWQSQLLGIMRMVVRATLSRIDELVDGRPR